MTADMPSVVASITDELDELIEWMVETGRSESRSDAAFELMNLGAHNKYEYRLDD